MFMPLSIIRSKFLGDTEAEEYGDRQTYKNLSGFSGIKSFRKVPGGVAVSFGGPGEEYDYTLDEGQSEGNIDHLKDLLGAGWGANTFINRFMRKS